MLAVLTAIILGGTQALNGYFLSPFSVKSMLSFFSILAFLSSAQLATVLVGAIDLSVGPLAGLCVVLASFLAPDGVETGPFAAGVILILLLTDDLRPVAGPLITSLRLPAIVVTIATFIGLQGVSLLLRPTAAGQIDDAISNAAQFPIGFLPAGRGADAGDGRCAPNGFCSAPASAAASAQSAQARLPAIGLASTAGA